MVGVGIGMIADGTLGRCLFIFFRIFFGLILIGGSGVFVAGKLSEF